MEQSAVFMRQWFQRVNNIGDLRKFCHKEAFLSLNKWKNRDPHVLQKLTPGSSERGPGETQEYIMEGGVKSCQMHKKLNRDERTKATGSLGKDGESGEPTSP